MNKLQMMKLSALFLMLSASVAFAGGHSSSSVSSYSTNHSSISSQYLPGQSKHGGSYSRFYSHGIELRAKVMQHNAVMLRSTVLSSYRFRYMKHDINHFIRNVNYFRKALRYSSSDHRYERDRFSRYKYSRASLVEQLRQIKRDYYQIQRQVLAKPSYLIYNQRDLRIQRKIRHKLRHLNKSFYLFVSKANKLIYKRHYREDDYEYSSAYRQ